VFSVSVKGHLQVGNDGGRQVAVASGAQVVAGAARPLRRAQVLQRVGEADGREQPVFHFVSGKAVGGGVALVRRRLPDQRLFRLVARVALRDVAHDDDHSDRSDPGHARLGAQLGAVGARQLVHQPEVVLRQRGRVDEPGPPDQLREARRLGRGRGRQRRDGAALLVRDGPRGDVARRAGPRVLAGLLDDGEQRIRSRGHGRLDAHAVVREPVAHADGERVRRRGPHRGDEAAQLADAPRAHGALVEERGVRVDDDSRVRQLGQQVDGDVADEGPRRRGPRVEAAPLGESDEAVDQDERGPDAAAARQQRIRHFDARRRVYGVSMLQRVARVVALLLRREARRAPPPEPGEEHAVKLRPMSATHAADPRASGSRKPHDVDKAPIAARRTADHGLLRSPTSVINVITKLSTVHSHQRSMCTRQCVMGSQTTGTGTK